VGVVVGRLSLGGKGLEAETAPVSEDANDSLRTGGVDAGTIASVSVGAGVDALLRLLSPQPRSQPPPPIPSRSPARDSGGDGAALGGSRPQTAAFGWGRRRRRPGLHLSIDSCF
jgi:hypothetical protein